MAGIQHHVNEFAPANTATRDGSRRKYPSACFQMIYHARSRTVSESATACAFASSQQHALHFCNRFILPF
jgi:hypothetical protein